MLLKQSNSRYCVCVYLYRVCVYIYKYRVRFVVGIYLPLVYASLPLVNYFLSPVAIKWFAKCTMKSRSESNDLRNVLLSPVLNQMICDTHFEVPFWIKLLATHTLKSRSESNSTFICCQDGAEDGSRVASSGKTLQFFVCSIYFFVVLRVRCC